MRSGEKDNELTRHATQREGARIHHKYVSTARPFSFSSRLVGASSLACGVLFVWLRFIWLPLRLARGAFLPGLGDIGYPFFFVAPTLVVPF